jgi:hypothetical protein
MCAIRKRTFLCTSPEQPCCLGAWLKNVNSSEARQTIFQFYSDSETESATCHVRVELPALQATHPLTVHCWLWLAGISCLMPLSWQVQKVRDFWPHNINNRTGKVYKGLMDWRSSAFEIRARDTNFISCVIRNLICIGHWEFKFSIISRILSISRPCPSVYSSRIQNFVSRW